MPPCYGLLVAYHTVFPVLGFFSPGFPAQSLIRVRRSPKQTKQLQIVGSEEWRSHFQRAVGDNQPGEGREGQLPSEEQMVLLLGLLSDPLFALPGQTT